MNLDIAKGLSGKTQRQSILVLLVLAVAGCGESVLTEPEQSPDPVVLEVPIAFIKRDLSVVENGSVAGVRNLAEPAEFLPGAALFIKSRASTSAVELNITDRLFTQVQGDEVTSEILPYDVKDLSASYDGTRLLFAMRFAPSDEQPEPTWNIWQYDRLEDTLKRIIDSDTLAAAGEDTGPVYLPDGRILFSSTRQRANQAILLDEGKPQYAGLEEGLDVAASVLHVMNSDGSNIRQISFNQSHDLDPIVAPNGKVVFSRWDQAAGDKGIHLYQMNSDGSDLEILYGRHSHQQADQRVQFTQTRIAPDERVLVALSDMQAAYLGGNFAIIDTQGYTDLQTPSFNNPGSSGEAQSPAISADINTNDAFSLAGRYGSLSPLWDGTERYVYSWSQCRALEPVAEGAPEGTQPNIVPCTEEIIADSSYEPAPPLFGLWLYDPTENTQLPLVIPQEGFAYTEVVAMESRPFPADPGLPERIDDLVAENRGVIHIRSIYDFAGEDLSPGGLSVISNPELTPVGDRVERFLRVTKSVSIPDDETLDFDNSAFGRSRNQLMREILGYTPIQPDGSVMVSVPANVPFAISIVDANGQRISSRHNNWLQVIPGEVKTCNGCHTPSSELPHGRRDAEAASINLGAPTNGGSFPGANPALFTDIGETMAQTYARVLGLPELSPDIVFSDIWSNPATTVLAPNINLTYAELGTHLPVSQACAQNWTALCRSTINFPEHIQPLFERPRLETDENGLIVADNTCIACHSTTDSEGEVQVPAGQLELTAQPSLEDPDVLRSYRELFFNDNALEIIEGVLVDIQVPVLDENGNPVFLVDEDGELVLDPNGEPIPLTEPVRVTPTMRTNGARASGNFLQRFDDENNPHSLWLTPVERKLISEWLDVGGQYYNNPFAIPQN